MASSLEEIQEELTGMDPRYKLGKVLGQGSYGMVLKALDSSTNEHVAMKRVHKDIMEDRILALRILREIKLLQHFRAPNVLALRNLVLPPKAEGTSPPWNGCLYIVMDLMETDLKAILGSQQALSTEHVNYLFWQLLVGLKHIHAAGVVHRDLTPGNILINLRDCDLKIGDLGLAREVPEDSSRMTDYVTVRWYRAPEVLLEGRYTVGVDVWAAGCIFAELLGAKPIFPGTSRRNQLDLIFSTVGPPSHDALARMGASEEARDYAARFEPTRGSAGVHTKVPSEDHEALDLLRSMLQVDPAQRISVSSALDHDFLRTRRDAPLEDVSKVRRFGLTPPRTTVGIRDEIYRVYFGLIDQRPDVLAGAAATAGALVACAIGIASHLLHSQALVLVNAFVDSSIQTLQLQRSGGLFCPRAMLGDTSTLKVSMRVAPQLSWDKVVSELNNFLQKQLLAPPTRIPARKNFSFTHSLSKSLDTHARGFESEVGLASVNSSLAQNPLSTAFTRSGCSPLQSTAKRHQRAHTGLPSVFLKSTEGATELLSISHSSQPNKSPASSLSSTLSEGKWDAGPSETVTPKTHSRTASCGGTARVSPLLAIGRGSPMHPRVGRGTHVKYHSYQHSPFMGGTPSNAPLSPRIHQDTLSRVARAAANELEHSIKVELVDWGEGKRKKLSDDRRPALLVMDDLLSPAGSNGKAPSHLPDADVPSINTPPPPPRARPVPPNQFARPVSLCTTPPPELLCVKSSIPPPVEFTDARSGLPVAIGIAQSARALTIQVGTRKAATTDRVCFDPLGSRLLFPQIRRAVSVPTAGIDSVLSKIHHLAEAAYVPSDLAAHSKVLEDKTLVDSSFLTAENRLRRDGLRRARLNELQGNTTASSPSPSGRNSPFTDNDDPPPSPPLPPAVQLCITSVTSPDSKMEGERVVNVLGPSGSRLGLEVMVEYWIVTFVPSLLRGYLPPPSPSSQSSTVSSRRAPRKHCCDCLLM